MNKLHVSYADYHGLIDQVIACVLEGPWRPDFIMGVSRGGLMLADGLSRVLKRPMAVVAAQSYQDGGDGAGTEQGSLKISASVASVEPVQGRVLLADDLLDSGATMRALVAHLQNASTDIDELKTAVIWVKPNAVFEPDYAAVRMQRDEWIVQPFEMRDFS